MTKLSIRNRREPQHVTAAQLQAGLVLACCNATGEDEVAFGDGLELALTRSAEGADPVVPEWVQVFPAGPVIKARDGREWKLPDPQVLIEAFTRHQADLPADIEHATEILAPKGNPAPAQGWAKELQVRDDKTVWARVDWNDAGKAAIAAKQYRYISPAFRFTKEGEIRALTSIALTTQPALTMPALARHEAGQRQPKEHDHMKTLAERLREAMGLGADANDDAIVTAATTQVALARDARDPNKLVPKTDLDAALARATTAETALTTIQKADKDTKAVSLVEGAIQDGKIPPASKDHYLALARENFELTENALKDLPKVLDTSKLKKLEDGDPAKDANGLTADQKALCRELGLEEKAFAANLPKEHT